MAPAQGWHARIEQYNQFWCGREETSVGWTRAVREEQKEKNDRIAFIEHELRTRDSRIAGLQDRATAGNIHINISNLKSHVLDKLDVLLAFNGNSSLSKQLVFKLFMYMWICPVLRADHREWRGDKQMQRTLNQCREHPCVCWPDPYLSDCVRACVSVCVCA